VTSIALFTPLFKVSHIVSLALFCDVASFCLKVETLVGGGVSVWSDPTLTNISQCSGPGITGNYVKLSHFQSYTTTQATYVSSVTPADWNGIAHFVGDATIKKSQLKILQFNGTGSANPLTFEVEIKVPVTKGCESASPSLTPSKELSVFPSLLPSILPSRLPSMIPSVYTLPQDLHVSEFNFASKVQLICRTVMFPTATAVAFKVVYLYLSMIAPVETRFILLKYQEPSFNTPLHLPSNLQMRCQVCL
jgi:hypothetical protein